MENSDDLNFIGCDLINNSEWKTSDHSTSEIAMYDWKEIGIIDNPGQRVIDALHKLQV